MTRKPFTFLGVPVTPIAFHSACYPKPYLGCPQVL